MATQKKKATKSSFVNGVETGEKLIQQTAGILVGAGKVIVNTAVVTPLRQISTAAQTCLPVKSSKGNRKPLSQGSLSRGRGLRVRRKVK